MASAAHSGSHLLYVLPSGLVTNLERIDGKAGRAVSAGNAGGLVGKPENVVRGIMPKQYSALTCQPVAKATHTLFKVLASGLLHQAEGMALCTFVLTMFLRGQVASLPLFPACLPRTWPSASLPAHPCCPCLVALPGSAQAALTAFLGAARTGWQAGSRSAHGCTTSPGAPAWAAPLPQASWPGKQLPTSCCCPEPAS